MSEEGERCFCRQLLLWFPRETVVEAATEKEWEGYSLAQMGHSSVRCLYTGGYLDFLNDVELWRVLKCWEIDKQQILIFFSGFLGKSLFLEFTSPILHQSLNILLFQGPSTMLFSTQFTNISHREERMKLALGVCVLRAWLKQHKRK